MSRENLKNKKEMKRRIVTLMLLTILFSPAFAQAEENREQPQIPQELITSPESPILLVFTADWCMPCHRMRAMVFPDTLVSPLLKKYNVVMLDIDTPTGASLEKRYCSAMVVPYYIILDKDGNRIAEQIGGSDAGTFAAFLKQGLPSGILAEDVDGGFVDSREVLRPKWNLGMTLGGGNGWFGELAARLNWYNGNFFETGIIYSSIFGIGVPADMNFRVTGPFSLGLGIAPTLKSGSFDLVARGRADFTFGRFGMGALIGYGLVNQNKGELFDTVHNLFYGVALTMTLK